MPRKDARQLLWVRNSSGTHWFMSGRSTTTEKLCPAGAGLDGGVLAPELAPDHPLHSSGAAQEHCFHCGAVCSARSCKRGEKHFCCQGCLTIYELLSENGLDGFYGIQGAVGVRPERGLGKADEFQFVDESAVRERLVDFSDGRITRVTFHLPAIHCIGCIWLLENLYRLKPGIGHTEVNFPQKKVAISFDPAKVKLSEVVALLSSLGYEPELRLSDLERPPRGNSTRRLWLQLGVAGFAFGNTMLFSIASYLGLDSASGPGFKSLVGWISLLLAAPVLLYSAQDYWRSAWTAVRQRQLNVEVPIVAGVIALTLESTRQVVTGAGLGYFDSLAGLLFFLLCGRVFQHKTFERLAFDRDYRSFFPLSVLRRKGGRERAVSLSQLEVGDVLVIRNGELIPADSRLIGGLALIDYGFVTGESELVEKTIGEYLYAGGRQRGGAIELEMLKPVSQGYLSSLWNQDAFRKPESAASLHSLTNRYSRRFTQLVIAIAVGAAAFWLWTNPALALKAFTSVLIVACPCALALAAPFALGTAQRVLARRNVFLRNPSILERLAVADSVVFDKTGTLTAGLTSASFHGSPLSQLERRWVSAIARHSTHPHAVRIGQTLGIAETPEPIGRFSETPGCGIRGSVAGHEVLLGSKAWLSGMAAAGHAETAAFQMGNTKRAATAALRSGPASVVHLAIDGKYRGCFELTHALRRQTDKLMANLSDHFQLTLLSGDNERDRARLDRVFGRRAQLHFNQSPLDKLQFIQRLQQAGRKVIMVGDGLNDAGALRQSDVGIAVVENVAAFSPASDIIMGSEVLPELHEIIGFARSAVRVVRVSFLVSALYNAVGIGIGASALLSPVICAILMPLSSLSVVFFACGTTSWLGRRRFG